MSCPPKLDPGLDVNLSLQCLHSEIQKQGSCPESLEIMNRYKTKEDAIHYFENMRWGCPAPKLDPDLGVKLS